MKSSAVNVLDTSGIRNTLNKLDIETKAKWGSLTSQHMVEHLSSTMKYSNGKIKHKLYVPEKDLEKYRSFLFQDTAFPKFFKSPVFEKDLPRLNNETISEAVDELLHEIKVFKEHFSNRLETKEMHPIFGELNFNEWVIYHNKHFHHHFNQFELIG
ncbi:hypothetical protein QQ008_19530 [Fulvivirgaceae bacterium BMA10]|uniref:DUF1569 domain-containing protein n=1 Tax=Splendidivirga corallicola TaxID=3051826 RepID=A0ABT8KS77_9BACT|nr:hypothetical protein [Fulvivirgaceae bacterium BMA10]